MILVLLELGNVSLPIMSLDFQPYRKFTFLKNIISSKLAPREMFYFLAKRIILTISFCYFHVTTI